jgi:uncharacterized protein involved in exopolysaccharide biosynthesis
VTSKELIQRIYLRIGKFKLLVLLAGFLMAAVLFFYGRMIPPVYTTKATVFPLTASNESSAASNALTTLLGGSDAPKSFSSEASINIVELAQSRNTREAVALKKLPGFNGKTVAELLIDNYNKSKFFYTPELKTPKDSPTLAAVGGNLLNQNFVAKTAKSGILELYYSSTNPTLISPITYAMIEKISQFYIDLKTRKAKKDYDFTLKKIDSLQHVLNTYDRRAVVLANTTLFVPKGKIEYSIPKENLINSKERGMRQRDGYANNREEALWRLQKATPIIDILDKPLPPYAVQKPSSMLYGFLGFMLGCFLAIAFLVAPILSKYVETETNKAIFGNEEGEIKPADYKYAEENKS